MKPSSYALVTEQEYFRREDATEERLEFYDGVIIPLGGAKPEHSLVAMHWASPSGCASGEALVRSTEWICA